MEKINKCCICGNSIEEIFDIKFIGLLGLEDEYIEKVGFCSKCGFIFNMNPFSESQLEKRYKKLSKYEFENKYEDSIETRDFILRSRIQNNFIKENCSEIESVFELGAATGYNLSLYKNEGMDVFGIEPSSANKYIANKKYGIKLYDDTFQNYLKKINSHKKYDLIFLSNVLEHIVNPMECIINLREFSSKYIFIEVPTFDYKFSDEIFGMFSDEHVNYFNFESLQNIMIKADYHLVNARIEFYMKCYNPSGTPSLMSIWEKNKIGDCYREKNIVCNSRERFEEYIRNSQQLLKKIEQKLDLIKNEEKLAIWGAGSHTARLLGITELKNKNIVKIYDSDEKKYNYKILNKEITEFDVNDIKQNKIDRILISSYASQNSIFNFIKDKISDDKIIKLYDI